MVSPVAACVFILLARRPLHRDPQRWSFLLVFATLGLELGLLLQSVCNPVPGAHSESFSLLDCWRRKTLSSRCIHLGISLNRGPCAGPRGPCCDWSHAGSQPCPDLAPGAPVFSPILSHGWFLQGLSQLCLFKKSSWKPLPLVSFCPFLFLSSNPS